MKFIKKSNPVNSIDILKWQDFFRAIIPVDFKDFLSETDGGILYDSIRDAEFQFLPLLKAIEYYECYEFDKYMNGAIPLCMDGNGNFAVYKKSSDLPYMIHLVSSSDLEWNASVQIGSDLEDLFKVRIEDRINEEF